MVNNSNQGSSHCFSVYRETPPSLVLLGPVFFPCSTVVVYYPSDCWLPFYTVSERESWRSDEVMRTQKRDVRGEGGER